MRTTRTVLAALLLAALLLAVIILGFALPAGGEHPPHTERPTAGAPVPAATSGADHPGDIAAWYEGVAFAQWAQGVLEGEAREQEAMAAARSLAAQSRVGPGVAEAYGGDCAALAAELGLSEAVLWRESRCRWDAVNVTGCSGRSCVGPAQVDLGHTYEQSPWNPKVPGTCYGLNLDDPADYATCVSRLPDSAW